MKLKDGFISQQVGEVGMMISPNWNGVIKNNEPAQYICDLLQEDTTQDAILDKLCARYDAPREVLAADLQEIIDQCRTAGLLEE